MIAQQQQKSEHKASHLVLRRLGPRILLEPLQLSLICCDFNRFVVEAQTVIFAMGFSRFSFWPKYGYWQRKNLLIFRFDLWCRSGIYSSKLLNAKEIWIESLDYMGCDYRTHETQNVILSIKIFLTSVCKTCWIGLLF